MSEAAVMTAPGDTAVPQVRFVVPLPGLEPLTRFALVRLDDAGLLYSLRSRQDPSVRLVAMPPSGCFPGYTPELDDDTAAVLGPTRSEDALTLASSTPAPGRPRRCCWPAPTAPCGPRWSPPDSGCRCGGGRRGRRGARRRQSRTTGA